MKWAMKFRSRREKCFTEKGFEWWSPLTTETNLIFYVVLDWFILIKEHTQVVMRMLPGEGPLVFLKKVQCLGANFCRLKRFDTERMLLNFSQRFLKVWYPNSKISFPPPSRTTFKTFKALSWASREIPMLFMSVYMVIFWNTDSSFTTAHLCKSHKNKYYSYRKGFCFQLDA